MAKGVFNASVFMGRPLYPADITTTVSVYNAETDELVPTLWLDRDGVETLGNPHPLPEDGVILFYADPGRYNIIVEKGTMLYREWPDVIISDSPTIGTPGIQSIVAGTNVTVDDTDPLNPVVNVTGGGGGPYPSVTESTTARTLVLSDAQKFIDCTNASGCAITVPPQSSVSWVADTEILGLGRLDNVTFIESSGVTIIKPSDRILECYAGAPWALRRLESNIWSLTGYLVEA